MEDKKEMEHILQSMQTGFHDQINAIKSALIDPDKLEETMCDMYVLTLINSYFAFAACCLHEPESARKLKDSWVEVLKASDVNRVFCDRISKFLTRICTILEE